MVIAIEFFKMGGNPILKVIGNQAFVFSFVLSSALALVVIPFAKRRPADKVASWGECMLGAMYAFSVMFVAFGVVPDRWIAHADAELGWNKTNVVYGPFNLLKPTPLGGAWNPITIPYEAIRDIVVVVIHVWYFGLIIFLWGKWQKRGQVKPGVEVATSTYGRPLVKKA